MMQTALRENDAVSTAPAALSPEERAFLDNLHKLPRWRQWLERQYVRLWYWHVRAHTWMGGLVVVVLSAMTGRD